jgi:excisionase family DNA binding protein
MRLQGERDDRQNDTAGITAETTTQAGPAGRLRMARANAERSLPAGERHPEAPSIVGDELLTVHDAARFLNVSVSWIYEHTRDDAQDRLPFVKLGKYVRFDRTDLRDYVNAKRHAARRAGRRR